MLLESVSLKWIIAGDFNDIESNEENGVEEIDQRIALKIFETS